MHAFVTALVYLNLVLFLGLAFAAVQLRRRQRAPAATWALLAFGSLAAAVVLGRFVPQHRHGLGAEILVRLDTAILLLFPYLLYRFATAFDPLWRRIDALFTSLTVTVVAWTFAQPSYPQSGQHWPASFVAYVVAFLFHWTVLAAFTARRLWVAGTGEPSVARRRMRLLALASTLLTAALFLSVVSPRNDSAPEAAAQLVATLSSLAFLLGLRPPAILRQWWRGPENRRVQSALESLVSLATTAEEVVARVLGPMAEVVGARGAMLHGADGRLLGTHNAPEGARDRDALHVPVAGGTLTVWTSPYAPFFGEEEVQLLETLGALTGIALDRVRLFVEEREARIAVERSNEVMANFITLAAHELRTPVTTIHGFVHTLNHLGDRLTPERREEVSRTLEQQTVRMARLVEQLLDLSRLDAQAIDIVPQRIRVRRRLEELVAEAVPERLGDVEVSADDGLEASVDATAFDRVVTNLVTNAFRYGAPPVTVTAERRNGELVVAVQDRGRGVEPQFVPDLFERFTRSEDSRERPGSTGLGLAIARSYARAHGGELRYSPGETPGARFEFLLPLT
jgi:K+-sensing histidine kinase KdpD